MRRQVVMPIQGCLLACIFPSFYVYTQLIPSLHYFYVSCPLGGGHIAFLIYQSFNGPLLARPWWHATIGPTLVSWSRHQWAISGSRRWAIGEADSGPTLGL